MKKILNVSNLKVNYGEIIAVKDISFHVREGQIVTITGANGAGKSSIMNALSGIFFHKLEIYFELRDLKILTACKCEQVAFIPFP